MFLSQSESPSFTTIQKNRSDCSVPKKYYVPNNSSEITVTSGDDCRFIGTSSDVPTVISSRNIPCATRYCEPATAGQVSSSESEHCYFGTGGPDLLFIFATVPRESEHTLCNAGYCEPATAGQVSSSSRNTVISEQEVPTYCSFLQQFRDRNSSKITVVLFLPISNRSTIRITTQYTTRFHDVINTRKHHNKTTW
ncbi:hypothetical protein ANN_21999 [Periplaneta americana]|uniref:Uncharacterized protein n=1 Tax=Periplaneta americana TaxID=6978 RepID=A0ABQ8S7T2_PERAM|nr:hypothetical protein ANN_21999 [Periplaneta americana]